MTADLRYAFRKLARSPAFTARRALKLDPLTALRHE
jgi:hypothetical protein